MLRSLVLTHFASLPDPRSRRVHRYPLHDLLLIGLCTLLSGGDDFTDMALFARHKKNFLIEHLGIECLRRGIPSHDTFNRIFAMLDPAAFARCMGEFSQSLRHLTQQEIIAIDGKVARRSFEQIDSPLHLVCAWAAKNRVVLAQRRVANKENEIVAVPELLQMLKIEGAIVTMDAMGCQKKLARQIRAKGADYVLALKDNHPALHKEVQNLFAWQSKGQDAAPDVAVDCCTHRTCGHGRIEERECRLICDVSWLDKRDSARDWEGLASLVQITSRRTIKKSGKHSCEVRYYLSSLSDARKVQRAVRCHWGIENRLHWSLDVVFGEDQSRARIKAAGENLSALRKIAIGILQREKSEGVSLRGKRKQAAWNSDYLLTLLTNPD